MNQTMARKLRKMAYDLDPKILIAVRAEYGEKTKDMSVRKIYRSAKKLYKRGLIKV